MSLSAARREHYLRGECLTLALALHARTGWEIVSMEEGDDPGDPDVCHVLVRLPDGRTLDADGLHEDYEVTPGCLRGARVTPPADPGYPGLPP